MKLNETEALEELIRLLHERQKMETHQIKAMTYSIVESLKPGNLIHHFADEVKTSPATRNKVLQIGIGWLGGMLVRKMVVGSSQGFIMKNLGSLAKFAFKKLSGRIFRR